MMWVRMAKITERDMKWALWCRMSDAVGENEWKRTKTARVLNTVDHWEYGP